MCYNRYVNGNLSHNKQLNMNGETPSNAEEKNRFEGDEKKKEILSADLFQEPKELKKKVSENNADSLNLTDEEKKWFDKGANA